MSFREAKILEERAKAFLANAERLIDEGAYDLAAFNIEQYCQLSLKYKLLIRTGSYPRTHSLISILKALSQSAESIKAFISDPKNVLYITKIEDAYIGARYLPRPYEEVEVRDMLKFAKERFKELIEKIDISTEPKIHQLRNYIEVAKEVKELAEKSLGEVEAYVFGSVVEGEPTALSDVDMLIVTSSISKERTYEFKIKAYMAIEAPIQLHIASKEEFENWYKRFVKKLEKID